MDAYDLRNASRVRIEVLSEMDRFENKFKIGIDLKAPLKVVTIKNRKLIVKLEEE